MKFGRPDSEYLKWRWKPTNCELTLFNLVQFLELVRGKSMAFVGDSLGKNQIQSLLCVLDTLEDGSLVHKYSMKIVRLLGAICATETTLKTLQCFTGTEGHRLQGMVEGRGRRKRKRVTRIAEGRGQRAEGRGKKVEGRGKAKSGMTLL
ncbi:hypothetical protein FNV43_RR12906 [Rhamnella rubrinervis]|uniref:Uncharacterized protein n=1 Tax=Rhamnella rubrinervis TaxID=2594499 RepID=A0A8K0MD88_9ROSA|nr:hypothetical protein FNV43_RR12906 [Rhamnella rubrinervis]